MGTVVDESRERATAFLTGTDYFAEVGLGKLAADARMLARLLLELADLVDAERSARVAIQCRAEELQRIIGKRADEYLRELA